MDSSFLEILNALLDIVLELVLQSCNSQVLQIAFNIFPLIFILELIGFHSKDQGPVAFLSELSDDCVLIIYLILSSLRIGLQQFDHSLVCTLGKDYDCSRLLMLNHYTHHLPLTGEFKHLQNGIHFEIERRWRRLVRVRVGFEELNGHGCLISLY